MIASLNGTVVVRDDPYVILEVNGVGYKVHATSDVLSSIQPDSKLKVFTYTHVREDILDLYGFSKYGDLKLFESLIEVSGVGPKTAIGIFAIGTAEQIRNAIATEDVSFFTSVPRLGSKNAQKLIIELKNKVGGADLVMPGSAGNRSELTNALKGFGFTTNEINDAVRNIDPDVKTVEEQIKLALKYLGK